MPLSSSPPGTSVERPTSSLSGSVVGLIVGLSVSARILAHSFTDCLAKSARLQVWDGSSEVVDVVERVTTVGLMVGSVVITGIIAAERVCNIPLLAVTSDLPSREAVPSKRILFVSSASLVTVMV